MSELFEFGGRNGAGITETLYFIALFFAEEVFMFFGFNTFGYDVEVQRMAKPDNCAGNRGIIRVI